QSWVRRRPIFQQLDQPWKDVLAESHQRIHSCQQTPFGYGATRPGLRIQWLSHRPEHGKILGAGANSLEQDLVLGKRNPKALRDRGICWIRSRDGWLLHLLAGGRRRLLLKPGRRRLRFGEQGLKLREIHNRWRLTDDLLFGRGRRLI